MTDSIYIGVSGLAALGTDVTSERAAAGPMGTEERLRSTRLREHGVNGYVLI